MPFIQGRYHMNPAAGQALEAAREAEAAMLALEQANKEEGRADGDELATGGSAKGPVHRIEIEASEVVPPHSGRAGRGFVARVHRQTVAVPDDAGDEFGSDESDAREEGSAQPPETHVFSDHDDLVDFLRDTLSSDCRKQQAVRPTDLE
jgi:hypothetical protein